MRSAGRSDWLSWETEVILQSGKEIRSIFVSCHWWRMLLRKQAANCQQFKKISNAISAPLHPPLGLFSLYSSLLHFQKPEKKKLVWLKNEYLQQRHKSKTIDYGKRYLLGVYFHISRKHSIIHKHTKLI